MSSEYLKAGEDFTDMEVKMRPDLRFRDMTDKEYEHCPKCKGHGGWNLTVDAYGKGKHFEAFCGACWGYGWIEKGSCAHEWNGKVTEHDRKGIHLFNCQHIEKCSKCGKVIVIDSSG